MPLSACRPTDEIAHLGNHTSILKQYFDENRACRVSYLLSSGHLPPSFYSSIHTVPRALLLSNKQRNFKVDPPRTRAWQISNTCVWESRNQPNRISVYFSLGHSTRGKSATLYKFYVSRRVEISCTLRALHAFEIILCAESSV